MTAKPVREPGAEHPMPSTTGKHVTVRVNGVGRGPAMR
jgi:hypothetical protein